MSILALIISASGLYQTFHKKNIDINKDGKTNSETNQLEKMNNKTAQKTGKQIRQAVDKVAKEYNATVNWGKENRITWLTLSKGSINPKIFDEVTSKLSKATGVDCYFNKCDISSIDIAMNADIDFYLDDQGNYIDEQENSIPESYRKERIEEYGTLFK